MDFTYKPEHVVQALESAATGPVAEGCVGGGTGMNCHEFKGGIGTSSRALAEEFGGWMSACLSRQTTAGGLISTSMACPSDEKFR